MIIFRVSSSAGLLVVLLAFARHGMAVKCVPNMLFLVKQVN